MLVINGTEINNLIVAGQRFSAVNNKLIGVQVLVKKGQEVLFVGGDQTSIKRFEKVISSKDQVAEVKQCIFLPKTNYLEDGDYWILALINIIGNNKVYVSAPVIMRFSDVTIQDENGGVNSPSYLPFIYDIWEVAPYVS